MSRACSRSVILGVLAGLMILTAGCSTLKRRLPAEGEAAQRDAEPVLSIISNLNSNLTSFKGIGRIRLTEPDQPTLTERVAWIAALPDKLAITVLAAGRPVVKIAADGKHLYAIDLSDPKASYKKIRVSDPRLDRLTRIPVTVREIAAILAGQIPLRTHSRALLQRADSGEEVTLVLEKWWSVVQKIHLSPDRQSVRRFEFFKTDGTLLYRGEILDTQVVQGFRVPLRVRLSTENGAAVQLDIERFTADVPITPAMFTLPPLEALAP